jgi:dynactin-5
MAAITMGDYVILKEDVIIRPTFAKSDKSKSRMRYIQTKLGSCIYIDKGTIILSHKIGNNSFIGKNCVIGHRAIVLGNCKILDNSVVCPDTVIPPFTVWGGRPARYIGDLPESFD